MRRRSLRFRVAAAFAGFGVLLSLLFTAVIYFAAHDVSRRLIDQTLRAELEDYMARRARNPLSLPPATASLRGYVVALGAAAEDLPEALRPLLPGQYESSVEATPYRVAVADAGGERFYILFNEERQRAREQRFLGYLAAAAGLMTLLATAIGLWLAGRVIAPVTELARTVGAARPERPPRLARDAAPADEIAELTRAFDHYHARLAAFIEREQAFAADASHELRTPLAVIRGAAEVLRVIPGLPPAQMERVSRIERAAAEMAELIAALLLLAREEKGSQDANCDAGILVSECVERYRPHAERRGTRLSLQVDAAIRLAVEPALFSIVVANLIRNAVAHTEGGVIEVSLAPGRLSVRDSGTGIVDQEMGRVFQRYYRGAGSAGSGIGLSLVKRICDLQAWQIGLESWAAGGTTATLSFQDDRHV